MPPEICSDCGRAETFQNRSPYSFLKFYRISSVLLISQAALIYIQPRVGHLYKPLRCCRVLLLFLVNISTLNTSLIHHLKLGGLDANWCLRVPDAEAAASTLRCTCHTFHGLAFPIFGEPGTRFLPPSSPTTHFITPIVRSTSACPQINLLPTAHLVSFCPRNTPCFQKYSLLPLLRQNLLLRKSPSTALRLW